MLLYHFFPDNAKRQQNTAPVLIGLKGKIIILILDKKICEAVYNRFAYLRYESFKIIMLLGVYIKQTLCMGFSFLEKRK